MQQSSATSKKQDVGIGLRKICCMLSILLVVPSCIYSFWHGVIPTSYFIFILVSLIFLCSLALTVYSSVRRARIIHVHARTRLRRNLGNILNMAFSRLCSKVMA